MNLDVNFLNTPTLFFKSLDPQEQKLTHIFPGAITMPDMSHLKIVNLNKRNERKEGSKMKPREVHFSSFSSLI